MSQPSQPQHAFVVVLGDLEASPRMRYHAEALAAEGLAVTQVGYASGCDGSSSGGLPVAGVSSPPAAGIEGAQARSAVAEPRRLVLADRWRVDRSRLPRAAFVLVAAARLLDQCAALLLALMRGDAPSLVLVQTPPALPTLGVAWLAARLRGARLVVDWHNFGDDMLALRLGRGSRLVALAGAVEGFLGRLADGHLCVSEAMRRELASRWRIDAAVLADRPDSRFRPLSSEEKRGFLASHPSLMPGHDPDAPDRAAVVVSSTSWTADEDFALLLDAAVLYEAPCAGLETGERRSECGMVAHRAEPGTSTLPPLRILVTGRGPGREAFERAFAERNLKHVRLHTAWLESDDYPKALACADLGVSLHRSASGVDLPMKAADMAGAGLAVAMLDYGPCVREMTGEGGEALLFRDAAELAATWARLFEDFPSPACALFASRAGALGPGELRRAGETWREGWKREAAPLLLGGRGAGKGRA